MTGMDIGRPVAVQLFHTSHVWTQHPGFRFIRTLPQPHAFENQGNWQFAKTEYTLALTPRPSVKKANADELQP